MKTSSAAFTCHYDPPTSTLFLHGDMDVLTFEDARTRLAQSPLASRIDLTNVNRFDIAGAKVLADYLAGAPPRELAPLPPLLAETWKTYNSLPYLTLPVPPTAPWWHAGLIHLGHHMVNLFRSFMSLVQMLGVFILHTGFVLKERPQELLRVISQQGFATAVRAVPIIWITSFVVGVVLCYEGVVQLAKFGAESSIVTLISYSVLREAGALVTAIVVAGRSGSAFTAEIGAMKVGEELDALTIMGINPVDVLIVPRVWTLILMLPLLTFMADLMGLLGGAVVCALEIDMSLSYFFRQVQLSISLSTFWVGLVKAPFFGLAIGLIGCQEGLSVKGSASSVGHFTTLSVVKSLFYVIILNSIFSVLFSYFRVG